MGVNTINKMSASAELCANKKSTNYSARKTATRNLTFLEFLKCEIKDLAGHSSEGGLDAYDSDNDDKIFAMSSAISKSRNSASTVVQKKNLSHRHQLNNLNLISPGLFIQHPLTTTTFLSEEIGMTPHGHN